MEPGQILTTLTPAKGYMRYCLYILFLVIVYWVCHAHAEEISVLSSKTDQELIQSLNELGSMERLAVVAIVSMRYRPPNSVVMHSKFPVQTPYPKGVVVPNEIIRPIFVIAMDGNDIGIRLAAVDALENFLSRTNIFDLFEK